MRIYSIALLLLVTLICVDAALWGNNNHGKDRVRMDDVKTVTLRRGGMTAGRRSSPIPQLQCTGGAARSYSNDISTVQCTNVGSDGSDAQWECKADLDAKVRFGSVEVSCEGYDYPDDPFILRGSCGLEYTLEFTDKGRQNQYHQQQNQYHHQQNEYHHDYNTHAQNQGGSKLKTLIMLGIVVFIFYNIYKQCGNARSNRYASRGANGGYPGSGYPGTGYPGSGYPGSGYPGSGYPGSGYDTGYPPGSSPYGGGGCNVPPPSQSWRPGFWTGLATGGFMGNLFRPRSSYGYGTRYTAPASYSTGSSFGSSSFSSGTSTRSSSGFGGTRRR